LNLLGELKRRNVFRVAAAYVVLAWLVLQMGDLLFDLMGLPDWGNRIVLVILLLGFPVALIFSYVYELTPEGVKKESEIDPSQSISAHTGRKLDYITIGMIILGVAIVGIDRFLLPEQQISAPPGTDLPKTALSPTEAPSAQSESQAAPAHDGQPSIAVLPFADMSPEGDQGYFSDGIAEEILNVLVRIDDLKVASRTSSFAFRGRQQNISAIAEELRVRHILEGSVRKSGDRVRITAQLIDAREDRHLWSETFDRELDDIFAIQDEIATAIVNALAGALGSVPEMTGGLVKAATSDLGAYDLFLQGRELFLARDRLQEGIDIMRQAVVLDPEFARAWEMLSALYSVAPSWGVGDPDEYLALSDDAADEALRLDPERYFAYAIKSQSLFNRSGYIDWQLAMDLNQRALDGDPKNATVWLWQGINHRFLGYHDRAASDFERCLELDPGYENCRNHRAFLAFETDDIDRALAWLDRHLMEVPVRHTVLFGFFVPEMVRRGDYRVAYLLADSQTWRFDGDARPIHIWIDGLRHPDESQERRIDRLRAWEQERGRKLGPLLWASLGAYSLLEPTFDLRQILWRDDLGEFRKSADFKRLVRDMGIWDYWTVHGFPARCRELNDGDFECD
jgi:TolB-like protein